MSIGHLNSASQFVQCFLVTMDMFSYAKLRVAENFGLRSEFSRKMLAKVTLPTDCDRGWPEIEVPANLIRKTLLTELFFLYIVSTTGGLYRMGKKGVYLVVFAVIFSSLFGVEAVDQGQQSSAPAAGKSAESQKENEQSDLVRVAILKFVNSSRSDQHHWVENSLPDAINLSMVNKFEFVRTEPEKVEAAQKQEKVTGDSYSKESIRRIAKKTNSDIIIYGYFKLTEKKDTLLIKAIVYNATGDKVIGTVTERSELSNRIFKGD